MMSAQKNRSSKMTEIVVETEFGGGTASSSFSKMAGQGEGIYASPTSADVGILKNDQNGLTLSSKTRARTITFLDTPMITDHEFEEASTQPEALSSEIDEQAVSFLPDGIYCSRKRNVSPLPKRRKFAGDLSETLLQNQHSVPVDRSKSPILSPISPKAIKVCATNQQHNDESCNPYAKSLEKPLSSTAESPSRIRTCQKDLENPHLSGGGEVEPAEETGQTPIALMSINHAATKCRRISTTRLDCPVARKDLRFQSKGTQNYDNPEVSAYEAHQNLVGAADLPQGKSFGDPDVPLQSIEEESQNPVLNCYFSMLDSTVLRQDRIAANGVVSSLFLGARSTDGEAVDVTENDKTRKLTPLRDSLQTSRNPLQTSTLSLVVTRLLENFRQALVDRYSKYLLSHQIPDELRHRLDALLKKFHTDKQFQQCVSRYIMDATGDPNPHSDMSCQIPPELRKRFDAVFRKYSIDKQFRKSLDRYFMELASDIERDMIVESETATPNTLQGLEQKNLEGLTLEQLTKLYRDLEKRHAKSLKECRKARDAARWWQKKAEGAPETNPKSADPIPKKGKWRCQNPSKTYDKSGTYELCGKLNPYYVRKLMWEEVPLCKFCGGPATTKDDDFVFKKWTKLYYQAAPKPTSPATAQPSNPSTPHQEDHGRHPTYSESPCRGFSSEMDMDNTPEESQWDMTSLFGPDTPPAGISKGFSEEINPDNELEEHQWDMTSLFGPDTLAAGINQGFSEEMNLDNDLEEHQWDMTPLFVPSTSPTIINLEERQWDMASMFNNNTHSQTVPPAPRPRQMPRPSPLRLSIPEGVGSRPQNPPASPTQGEAQKKRTPAKGAKQSKAKPSGASSKEAKPKKAAKPFTAAEMEASKTANFFLGGARKKWEKGTVETACSGGEAASQVPRGTLADQDVDRLLYEEFSAEFDLLDREREGHESSR